jgi:hypothetical protein
VEAIDDEERVRRFLAEHPPGFAPCSSCGGGVYWSAARAGRYLWHERAAPRRGKCRFPCASACSHHDCVDARVLLGGDAPPAPSEASAPEARSIDDETVSMIDETEPATDVATTEENDMAKKTSTANEIKAKKAAMAAVKKAKAPRVKTKADPETKRELAKLIADAPKAKRKARGEGVPARKHCARCDKTKDTSTSFYIHSKGTKTSTYCKPCHAEAMKEQKAKREKEAKRG